MCETATADQANVNQAPTPYLTDSEARSTFGETEVTSVEVPSDFFAPCSQLLVELQSSINPLSECSDIDQGYYMTAIQLAGHHLANCAN